MLEISWANDVFAWQIWLSSGNPATIYDLAFRARLDRDAVDAIAPSIRHDLSPNWRSPVYFTNYDDAAKIASFPALVNLVD